MDTRNANITEVAAAVLWFSGKVWIQRRIGTNHLENYWEFPGGKIQPGETPLEAVSREVKEEVGINLSPIRPELLLVQEHSYPDREIRIHFFLCPLRDGSLLGNGQWVAPGELGNFTFPPANSVVLRKIQRTILARIMHKVW